MLQPRKQQQYWLTIIEKLYKICSLWAGRMIYMNREPRTLHGQSTITPITCICMQMLTGTPLMFLIHTWMTIGVRLAVASSWRIISVFSFKLTHTHIALDSRPHFTMKWNTVNCACKCGTATMLEITCMTVNYSKKCPLPLDLTSSIWKKKKIFVDHYICSGNGIA
jgi:hypothetical protein